MIRIPALVRRSALLVPIGAATALVRAAWDVPAAIGGRPAGARLDRMLRSPRFRDGRFHNLGAAEVPTTGEPDEDWPLEEGGSMLRELVLGKQRRKPAGAVPLDRPGAADFGSPPTDGVRVTWLGHSTALVEVEGARVLFDPVWSDRVSPSALIGPRRMHPVPVPLAELPRLDAVVISHDHYDHLDMHTVRRLAARQRMPFAVPLGVGAHLERWGVPEDRIIELDWEESATVGGLRLTATAARHFSGRLKPGGNGTLWASWVVAGRDRRVFYSGDSGYCDEFAEIGKTHGPFDASLIQIGAYSPYWPDIHMTPEQGVATHLAVRGEVLIPVHWGTFNLAMHSWSEPVERLLADADRTGVRVAVPRPGQLLDLDADAGRAPRPWWRAVA